MDIVFIHGLKVETVIGIYDWEREIKQPVVIDLEMGTDISAAAANEAIENTLNYKAVSDWCVEFVAKSEFLLVETMAETLAEQVLSLFGACWVRVKVGKPDAIADARNVGVIIERGEKS